MTTFFYNKNAAELAKQYLSKSFNEVHQSWHQLLPAIIENPNARILDIGAGSGRDAKYIAQAAAKKEGDKNGTQVMVVDPVTNHKSDRLPTEQKFNKAKERIQH